MFKLYVKWMHVHTHVSVCMHVREGGTEEGGERGETDMETERTHTKDDLGVQDTGSPRWLTMSCGHHCEQETTTHG